MSTKIPTIDMVATGQNIKQMRNEKNISVRELQEIIGFTNPQAIYKWQNGMSIPTLDNLVILASVLGTTIDDIIVTM